MGTKSRRTTGSDRVDDGNAPAQSSKRRKTDAPGATVRKRDQPEAEPLSKDERLRRISELAYQFAEKRGFEPGGDVDDWLTAERMVDAEPIGN